jgi:3-methyladenine DNA glycosylase AlkD
MPKPAAPLVDARSIADDITQNLSDLGRGSRQGHRPSAQRDFGVYTPALRGVVQIYRKRLAPHPGEFVYETGLSLLARNITECRQVAYELIAAHREARESLTPGQIEALGAGIDNWACVDGFCCTLVGTAWREGRISDATIRRWSRSDDLWWRRAAVVATVPLNTRSRGGTGDTRRTVAVCRSLIHDKEIMVQKAISWALRALVTWDRKAVQAFVDEHGQTVPALVRREVLRKLETGKKN